MFRRGSTAFLAVVLVLSVLPALPAGALVSEACPTMVPGVSFTDLVGLTTDAADAIKCITQYDVANGFSSTIFGPDLAVPRWQMALFLTRMVTALGLALPNGAGQGFTDISGFDSATQTAINQTRQLGISLGTSTTTYGPNGIVTRWQMALFLTRLLTSVGIGLPGLTGQGFTDIASFDVPTQNAINQLRQLGITLGTTSTTYSPNVDVVRWQMALFLARALETGGGSPFRITLSLSSTTSIGGTPVVLTITVKNPDGTPAANRQVDVFVAASIDSNGKCVLDGDATINSGDAGTGTNCVIDGNDPQTNSNGVVTVSLGHNAILEVDTIYAWIGESGEIFDLQDVRGEKSVQLTWGAPATGLNLPTMVVARYGTTGSIKAQLTGAGGVSAALGGQNIKFIVKRSGATILNQTVVTAADGSATLAYVGPADPQPGIDDPTLDDTITAFWDKNNNGTDDGGSEPDDTGTMRWDDEFPLVTSATLSQTEVSSLLAANTTITMTVLDKFGTPAIAARVRFLYAAGPTEILTNGQGQASFTYTVAQPATGTVDIIDAEVDLNNDGDVSDPGDLASSAVTNLTHFWVAVASTLAGSTKFDIIAVNISNHTIDVKQVVGTTNYYRLSYDSNDQFNVSGGNPESLTQFESALAALTFPDLDGAGNTELETNPYSTPASASSVFLLTP